MARRRSLNVKLLVVLAGAALAGVLVWLGTALLGGTVVRRSYLSQEARQRRVEALAENFTAYIRENQVNSVDLDAVEQWNRANPYAQLTIRGRDTVLTSDRYGAGLMTMENGLVIQGGAAADYVYPFGAVFADGAFQVYLAENSETRLYELVQVVGAVLAVGVFLTLVLIYNSRMIWHIKRLSRQVGAVSRGDLERKISPETRDELGALATDVDQMRLSILDKLQREEQAWEANHRLLTALSHDVRTPLTALMGYLEVLETDQNLTREQRETYLTLCQGKAEKLRELTNELFQYFLVFGSPLPESRPEPLEAQTLLSQLFWELGEDVRQRGFQLEWTPPEEDCTVLADPQQLCRVFDNLFSNIRKYADPAWPVEGAAWREGDRLHIRLRNAVGPRAGQVESTKIGLQTCEKLMEAMGGSFCRALSEGHFSAELELRIQK